MKRLLLIPGLGVALAWPLALFGQPSASGVSTLLEHSKVESILPGFHDGVSTAIRDLGIELTSEQASVLEGHFAPAALLPIMRTELAAQDANGLAVAAADLVSGGAIGVADSIADSVEPTTTLEAYAQQLESNRPPDARIQLVAQIAAAQSAGDFFVLLGERTREAAHLIARAVSSTSPVFDPISADEWRAQAEQYFFGALISFLHRYEPVSDALLQQALADWSSEAGAWYVQGYSLALGEAVLIAANNVIAELRAR